MELNEVARKGIEALQVLVNLKVSGVIAVSTVQDGWRVTVELVERSAIPDGQDLLGVYEVRLDQEGEMTGYERIRVRRRSDLEERVE